MRKAIPRGLVTWIALLQVFLLTIAFAVPASAATTSTSSSLLKVLTEYKVVLGDEKGNLNLEKPITRAEMITIMVRAVGGEKDVKYFTSLRNFVDVQPND